jgi:hypothetical protein
MERVLLVPHFGWAARESENLNTDGKERTIVTQVVHTRYLLYTFYRTACPKSHPPRTLTLISGNSSLAPSAICPSLWVHLPLLKSRFGLLNADMSYVTYT